MMEAKRGLQKPTLKLKEGQKGNLKKNKHKEETASHVYTRNGAVSMYVSMCHLQILTYTIHKAAVHGSNQLWAGVTQLRINCPHGQGCILSEEYASRSVVVVFLKGRKPRMHCQIF